MIMMIFEVNVVMGCPPAALPNLPKLSCPVAFGMEGMDCG